MQNIIVPVDGFFNPQRTGSSIPHAVSVWTGLDHYILDECMKQGTGSNVSRKYLYVDGEKPVINDVPSSNNKQGLPEFLKLRKYDNCKALLRKWKRW